MRRMTRQYGAAIAEEAWSEVILERAHRVCETYDPGHSSAASIETHFVRNMLWYVHKWVKSRGLGGTRLARDRSGGRACVVHVENVGVVEHRAVDTGRRDCIMRPEDQRAPASVADDLGLGRVLTPFEVWLVVEVVVHGASFRDVANDHAEHLGEVTSQTVSRWYREAIAKARDALGDELFPNEET